MQYRFIFGMVLGVCLLLGGTLLAAEAPANRPLLLSQTTDVYDNTYFAEGDFYTKEELERRIADAAGMGYKKLYFRAIGPKSYHPDSYWRHQQLPNMELNSFRSARSWRQYDVLREFIRVAHKHDLQVYYWEPIFDNGITWSRYSPSPYWSRQYGDAWVDPLLPPQACEPHRFAKRPQTPLKAHIGRIELKQRNIDGVTAENLAIYVAKAEQPFVLYTGPRQVEVKTVNGAPTLVISNLDLDCDDVKLVNDTTHGRFQGYVQLNAKSLELYYVDGTKVDAISAVETSIGPEADPTVNQEGYALRWQAWGDNGWNVIIRGAWFQPYAAGIANYAHPVARVTRLGYVQELLERYPGLDGITFSIRTHCCPSGGSFDEVGPLIYGFDPKVVREYQKLYGVDPTKQDYDVNKFQTLRGNYLTTFLAEAAKMVHASGRKFEMMVPVNRANVRYNCSLGSQYPLWEHPSTEYYFQVERWAKEGIIDGLILLGGNYGQSGLSPEWAAEIKRFRKRLGGAQVKLIFHHIVQHSRPEQVQGMIHDLLANPDIDELELYEEYFLRDYKAQLEQELQTSPRPLVKQVQHRTGDVAPGFEVPDNPAGGTEFNFVLPEKDRFRPTVKAPNGK